MLNFQAFVTDLFLKQMKNLFILILFATSQLVFGQSPLLPIWANDFDYIEEAVEKVTDGPNPLENIVVAGDLVINEFMAINQTSVADQNGEYDDWIELYNNTDSTLSLSGLYLTDNPVDSSRWFFPDTIIDPHGFLIIWDMIMDLSLIPLFLMTRIRTFLLAEFPMEPEIFNPLLLLFRQLTRDLWSMIHWFPVH